MEIYFQDLFIIPKLTLENCEDNRENTHKKMYHGTLTMYHGTLSMYHGTFSYVYVNILLSYIFDIP